MVDTEFTCVTLVALFLQDLSVARSSVRIMSSDEVTVVLGELDAAFDKLAAVDLDTLTHPELLAVLDHLETHRRRQPAVEHKLIARLAAEASPTELGATSLAEVLWRRLRISKHEARRRIAEAEDLGPRRAISGEPLEPRLPATAAGQADGNIGPEHVRIIRRFFDQLPGWVDTPTRAQAETTLRSIAAGLGPDELRQAADRLLALLDQDGEAPTDAERARRRHLILGKQGADGMSEIRGLLDPEARATLDAVFAKLAAPGMCNPDDHTPCVDSQPSEVAIQGDARRQPQRNHDALKAMGRSVLASGELGQHNGLPATIIVSTTLKELESGCGQAVAAGGTLLPMSDVIRLASHAYHYLVIFDRHTEIPLYLGRSRRLASPGQRIVLHANDRGCTFPGCTAPGYRLPGPPRRNRLGQRRSNQHRPTRPWPAGRTTAWSPRAAGKPENAKTAAPNGSHHHISMAANPASMTTTTPTTTSSTTKTTRKTIKAATAGTSYACRCLTVA